MLEEELTNFYLVDLTSVTLAWKDIEYDVLSRFWSNFLSRLGSWILVRILKLKFCPDFETEFRSRFWIRVWSRFWGWSSVIGLSKTQLSGPLCLWQCLVLQVEFHTGPISIHFCVPFWPGGSTVSSFPPNKKMEVSNTSKAWMLLSWNKLVVF